MKVLVVLAIYVAAIFAAPAIDEDVRQLENHNSGDFNDVEEQIHDKTSQVPDLSTISINPTIQDITKINEICMEETKIDKTIVEMVLSHQIIPTVPKYRKFLACSYRKQKYLNERGEIQFQNIMRFLSKYYKREDLKVLEVCGELKQTKNGGDNAYNVLKCLLPKLLPLQEISDE